ncbi:hypothetical protein [Rhodococcus gannanensis]|uniref:Uncharacterized protein n=1 Tax=Rhodococcus gannanensis TaxID=1960308 RepID=A0ABW4NY17_9NOCA
MYGMNVDHEPGKRITTVDREPTPQTDEPIRWPDPSPLHDWWVTVMAGGKPDAAP